MSYTDERFSSTVRGQRITLPDITEEDFLETIAVCRTKAQDQDFKLSVDPDLIVQFGDTARSFSQMRRALLTDRSADSLPSDMRGLAALSDVCREELPLNKWAETLDEPFSRIDSAAQTLQTNARPTFNDLLGTAIEIYESLGTLHHLLSGYRDAQGKTHPFCSEAALTIEKEILQSFGTDLTEEHQGELDLARARASRKYEIREWERLSAPQQIQERAPLALWVAMSALHWGVANSGTASHRPHDVM